MRSICRNVLAYLLNSFIHSSLGSTFTSKPGSVLDAGELEVSRAVLTQGTKLVSGDNRTVW